MKGESRSRDEFKGFPLTSLYMYHCNSNPMWLMPKLLIIKMVYALRHLLCVCIVSKYRPFIFSFLRRAFEKVRIILSKQKKGLHHKMSVVSVCWLFCRYEKPCRLGRTFRNGKKMRTVKLHFHLNWFYLFVLLRVSCSLSMCVKP